MRTRAGFFDLAIGRRDGLAGDFLAACFGSDFCARLSRRVNSRAASTRDDQGVESRGVTQTGLRLKNDAGFSTERPAGQTDDNHLVTRSQFPGLIFRYCDGKCVGWSDQTRIEVVSVKELFALRAVDCPFGNPLRPSPATASR